MCSALSYGVRRQLTMRTARRTRIHRVQFGLCDQRLVVAQVHAALVFEAGQQRAGLIGTEVAGAEDTIIEAYGAPQQGDRAATAAGFVGARYSIDACAVDDRMYSLALRVGCARSMHAAAVPLAFGRASHAATDSDRVVGDRTDFWRGVAGLVPFLAQVVGPSSRSGGSGPRRREASTTGATLTRTWPRSTMRPAAQEGAVDE